MISVRLKSITKFLDKNDIIMDVGCDHALLDIYLIKNNIVTKAYASDINKNALKCGLDNVKKYNLEDKISLIHTPGINELPDNVNTLILAGMGSYTIIKILSETDKLKQINKIIVQSNNHHYLLRKQMLKNGFIIKAESIVFSKNKYFVNILFVHGHKTYSKDELMFGPMLIKNKNNKEYFNTLRNDYKHVYKMVPNYKIKKKILMHIKLKRLNKYC